MSRSLLIVVVVAFLLGGGGPLAGDGCTSAKVLSQAVARITKSDWSQVTTVDIRRMWPRGRVQQTRADVPVGACNGTTTLSYRRLKRDSRCLCCETFVFDHGFRGNSCRETLKALSLYYEVGDRSGALDVATTMLRAAADESATPEWVMYPHGVEATALPERPTSGGLQRVTATISKHSDRWLVNVTIARAPATDTHRLQQ